ncbi:hypothetical protein SAMN05216428_11562 [Nitrosospira sp. Nsp11]|uniref:hypothetical protein n=1 Tax=Nitrosospira sp. Nsp11 TaxID=1855338 RepID=UPI00090F680D|nr:hypothetical protein [Nitrosospira sp. Nsp11]SHM15238.1 hypothetical protein SAMN05216428_11562 [Nitrosospira sp. Nsp11]
MTITSKQCTAYGDTIRQKVDEFFDPRIEETQKLIDSEIAAGRDPEKYPIQDGIATINLVRLLAKIKEMKELGKHNAAAHEDACDKEAVPDWIGDAQKVSDIALGIAMLPFILLTGNMAMAHVDLGEVYKGTPFGGPNALIPKMREDVLDFLQIGGDVRKFIKDPFNVTQDFFSQGIEDLKKWLEKPFG